MSPDPLDRLPSPPGEVRLIKKPVFWVAVVIALLLGAGFYFWWMWTQQQTKPPEQPAQAQPAPSPEPEVVQVPPEQRADSGVQHPLPPAEALAGVEAKPLPPLAESDPAVREALAAAIGQKALTTLPLTAEIVRRVVATIDNLPSKQVAARLLPLKPPPGQMVTAGQGEALRLSSRNYSRYARYMQMAKAVDAKKLVAVYVHFYPLFQQSYEELGYPGKYFNDRLIFVIDHLLATQDVSEPVELAQPKVLFEFADPELEDLSAGQKLLIRVGPENAAVIKAKLREIRSALVVEAPAPDR